MTAPIESGIVLAVTSLMVLPARQRCYGGARRPFSAEADTDDLNGDGE